MVSKKRVEEEIINWARWCNSGCPPHPIPPAHCQSLEGGFIELKPAGESDDRPPLIDVESAKVVQRVYDAMRYFERKVMQAEYLSPRMYNRYRGVPAAAAQLDLSVAAYESILKTNREMVGRAFA